MQGGFRAGAGMQQVHDPNCHGLVVAYIQVVPVQLCADEPEPPGQQIRILSGMGWGDGRHPTTRLCLEFLSMEGVICGGERVIDYGTGSGVLSIGEKGDGRQAATRCVEGRAAQWR